MICPACGSINRDDARLCKECGIRLSGRAMRPVDAAQEKKYFRVGLVAAVILAAILIFVISTISCTCGGCNNAGEDFVNDNVDGEWSAIEVVSETDTSGSDMLA